VSHTILPLDLFYKVGHIDSYDVPRAFDWNKVKDCIDSLRRGTSYTLYHYDYSTSSYDVDKAIQVHPSDVIILEGIYAQYAKFLLLDDPVVIRVTTPPDVCLMRRLARDESSRNIPMKETVEMWKQKVRPGWNHWNQPDILAERALTSQYTVSGEDTGKQTRMDIYEEILFE